MSVLSRPLFVPAAAVVLMILIGLSPRIAAAAGDETAAQSAAPQTAAPQTATQQGAAPAAVAQHIGTAAIDHTTSKDAGAMFLHVQQQLTRLTGVAEPRPNDVETLGRVLDAARSRQIKPERMTALTEALAKALATGTFEEVTLARLSEDIFAALNSRTLSKDQAALVALDVDAALKDLGVQEPHVGVVLSALQGVCPAAVETPQATTDGNGSQKAAPKRALLTLSRESSE